MKRRKTVSMLAENSNRLFGAIMLPQEAVHRGLSALMLAADCNRVLVVEQLIKYGAQADFQTNVSRSSKLCVYFVLTVTARHCRVDGLR